MDARLARDQRPIFARTGRVARLCAYAWCHENPRPPKSASGTGIYVPLSAACRS